MSAFPDAPDHFARWLGDSEAFAERRVYGRYLEALLAEARAEAGCRLTTVEGDAVDIRRDDEGEQVRLASGETLSADAVVLALGNLPPEVPPGIGPDALDGTYVADPWRCDIGAGLGSGDTVFLIGTGLTAVDSILTLDAGGFAGRIVAMSRRGLMPRAHVPWETPPPLDRPLSPRCTGLARAARAEAERIGWRAAVDQLRPVTQQLWSSASAAERRRFLRHLRAYWEVHRHRIAPEVAGRLEALRREGRLTAAAGKLIGASAQSITWRPRGTARPRQLAVSRIVNCTGPQADIGQAEEPLLANLLGSGRIRPGPCRIGIDVDPELRVLDRDSRRSGSLYAVGPMTRGALWEIVAVPDIRVQVAELAARLR